MEIIYFILYLLVASACAYIAEYLAPGVIPGGFLVSVIVGVIGAWIGTALMGSVGPSLVGVPLIPAIIGSAITVFLVSLISHGFYRRYR